MSNDNQIFIGGVGRTGTQAIALMLHAIPSIFVLDEPRFLCVAGGVPSFLNGDISFPHLLENVAKHFNYLVGDYPSELWKLPDVYTTENIIQAFEAIPKDSGSVAKCFHLVDIFTRLGMTATNRTQWAIKEPGVVSQVPWASFAFPNFKLIHVIREPKDACSSVITKHWGKSGLEWAAFNYRNHLRMAFAGMMNNWVKERKIHVISLENFLANPDFSVRRLLSFLELSVEPDLLKKLISNVDERKGHVGRWRAELSTKQAFLVDAVCNSVYYDFVQYERECLKYEHDCVMEKKL